MRALKEYVANERINIRRKFRDNETMQNFTNFFITTNYFFVLAPFFLTRS
ncbi:DUF5906 domain-containing protein [Helicobacter pylori]